MSLERGRISSRQLIYLFIGYTLSSAIVLPTGAGAHHDAWLAILLGCVEGGIVIWIYSALIARFQGKTFVEISAAVYGRYLGKVVAGLYLWFLFHLGSLIIGDFTEFLMTTIMTGTPRPVMAIGLVLVAASAVRNGVEVIARCAEGIIPSFVFNVVVTVLLLIGVIDLQNFLPVADVPLRQLLFTSHQVAMFPLGETVVFMMILPYMKDSNRAPRTAFKALIITGALGLALVFRNIGVLGVTARTAVYPGFYAERMIAIGDIISRVEVLVVVATMGMGFLAITTLLYGVTLGTAQVLKLRSRLPLIIPFGVLLVITSELNFANMPQLFEFVFFAIPIYHLLFAVITPLATLVLAILRGLPSREERRPLE